MKIDHVAIWAKNIERLKTFYETYFSAKAHKKYTNSDKGFTSYFLTFTSGTRLEIMHMQTIPDNKNNAHRQFTGFIHLAISVGSKENVDTLTHKLSKDGYDVLDGPRTTGDGYYESVILDPENNRIEITI